MKAIAKRILIFIILFMAMACATTQMSSERKELKVVDKEAFNKFIGAYEFTPMVNMIITVSDGQLISKLGPQPQVPLFPESETKFFAKVVDAQIEFEQDKTGAVTALILYQNGREIRAPRVADRKEVSLPSEVLAQYAGTYELAPGFDLTITVEGNQLVSQATGQEKAHLYAEAYDKFFLKVANAQIEFVRSDDQVVALILHQGGRDIRAPRK